MWLLVTEAFLAIFLEFSWQFLGTFMRCWDKKIVLESGKNLQKSGKNPQSQKLFLKNSPPRFLLVFLKILHFHLLFSRFLKIPRPKIPKYPQIPSKTAQQNFLTKNSHLLPKCLKKKVLRQKISLPHKRFCQEFRA